MEDMIKMVEIAKKLAWLSKDIATLSDDVKKVLMDATDNNLDPKILLAYSEGIGEVVNKLISE